MAEKGCFVHTFKRLLGLISFPRRMHHVQSSHKSNMALFVNSFFACYSMLVGGVSAVLIYKIS